MFSKKPTINPIEEQRAKLQELGVRLREIRTEQGLSLDKIARKTRIPLRLLKAIEMGDLDSLPEPVYIRGLMKQFAETLGLDGLEFVSSFPTYLSSQQNQSRFRWRLPGFYVHPFHLYLFYIFLLVVSLQGISSGLKESTLEMSRLETPPNVAQPNPIKKPKQPQATGKKTPTKPVMVDVKLKNDCWLKVVIDGKTEFEGVLPQGTHRTWGANEQLTVRAGNAGGVMVTFNNQGPKQLGQSGEVQEVTYKLDSPAIRTQ
jgi:cytoskeletal protein RodZ